MPILTENNKTRFCVAVYKSAVNKHMFHLKSTSFQLWATVNFIQEILSRTARRRVCLRTIDCRSMSKRRESIFKQQLQGAARRSKHSLRSRWHMELHLGYLREAFNRFSAVRIRLKFDKCQFLQNNVAAMNTLLTRMIRIGFKDFTSAPYYSQANISTKTTFQK